MRGILKRHRIDIVHSNQLWSYPTHGVAALGLGIPRVCHIRDECSRDGLAWFVRSGADAIVSVSRHIGQQVELSWPTTIAKPRIWTVLNAMKIDPVLLNPVQMPDIDESDLPSQSVRTNFGFDPAEVIYSVLFGLFGFVGQLAPVKGLLPMLDAVAGLPRSAPWRLLVAGRDPHGGQYYQACVNRVAALGPDPAGDVHRVP